MCAVTIVPTSVLVLWPIMALTRLTFAVASGKPATQSGRRLANFSQVARGIAFTAWALALWFELSFALAELRLEPSADFYGIPAPVKYLLWALSLLMIFAPTLLFFSVIT